MSAYKIISDSSCDLPQELVAKYDIEIIPFYVCFDSIMCYKEGFDITNEEFYRYLSEKGMYAKTSTPNIDDYFYPFKKYLDSGYDVICICISSSLSGSMQCAINAKNMLIDDYPNRRIEIIDSLSASAGQGLLVLECAKMLEKSIDFKKNIETLTQLSKTIKIFFTVDTLKYLQKGGRLGKIQAFAGELLNLKPIISCEEGNLKLVSKIRGRLASLDALIKKIHENIGNYKDEYSICIANSDSANDVLYLENEMKIKNDMESEYPYFDVGITIGAHTGKNGIAIGYIKKFENVIEY